MVYCGGLSDWQCIREAVGLFRQLRPYLHPSARLMLITPDVASAENIALAAGVDDSIARMLPPAEVHRALAACDIGLMLREATLTNHCAFPNRLRKNA